MNEKCGNKLHLLTITREDTIVAIFSESEGRLLLTKLIEDDDCLKL